MYLRIFLTLTLLLRNLSSLAEEKQEPIDYVCGELDNTVTVLKYNDARVDSALEGDHHADTTDDGTNGLLTQIQTVSTLPGDVEKKSTIAEMRLHPSGR